MRARIAFGRFLIRLGNFMKSLAVVVMRPDDLVEFNREEYASPKSVESWSVKGLVDSGLDQDEATLLEKLPLREGRLLLLGVGGGREAISLAQMGFDVTAVDFVPEMVERASENAAQQGVKIEGLVQEISRLDVPAGSYDVGWLFAAMYSSIPTRRRRVEMLRRITMALRPGGYFLCQFLYKTRGNFSRQKSLARKAIAFVTLGNLWYEEGDMLWSNAEFIHAFPSEKELRSEFEAVGFEIVHIHIPEAEGFTRGRAVLKKS